MITEWEYLYCKLLLISKIIDGDDGLMMSKQPSKATNQKNKVETVNERLGSASQPSSVLLNCSNDLNKVGLNDYLLVFAFKILKLVLYEICFI